jgi:hypothetical protein
LLAVSKKIEKERQTERRGEEKEKQKGEITFVSRNK